MFHAPALWGSSLCLQLHSLSAVSVSFHSLQGAGLHCSYEHRLGRLWAQVQLEQKAPGRSLESFCARTSSPGSQHTISASNLLLTVSTQFHVQATNAVLIRHPSAWGLWLRASGQLTPTVHFSFNFSHVQVLSPARVGLMEPEERGSKSRLCPTTGCVWASLQEPNNRERWDSRGPRGVGCQSRWPGGRDKNVHPHRITWCHPLP